MAEFGMTSESSHIRQASEEIVLYLLKGEKVMGPKLWQTFVEKVLEPNLAFLECFAATTSVEKFDSDARKFLGNFIMSMLHVDPDHQVISGLSAFDVLISNCRLLLSAKSGVRDRALTNLKCFLSQEKNSHLRLPRFSVVAETDLKDYFIGVKFQVCALVLVQLVATRFLSTLG